MSKRIYISKKALLVAQHNRCWLCGAFMRMKNSVRTDPLQCSRDHIVPRSDGGTGMRANILYAHRDCNSTRGNKSLTAKEIARARNYRLAAIAYQLAT